MYDQSFFRILFFFFPDQFMFLLILLNMVHCLFIFLSYIYRANILMNTLHHFFFSFFHINFFLFLFFSTIIIRKIFYFMFFVIFLNLVLFFLFLHPCIFLTNIFMNTLHFLIFLFFFLLSFLFFFFLVIIIIIRKLFCSMHY